MALNLPVWRWMPGPTHAVSGSHSCSPASQPRTRISKVLMDGFVMNASMINGSQRCMRHAFSLECGDRITIQPDRIVRLATPRQSNSRPNINLQPPTLLSYVANFGEQVSNCSATISCQKPQRIGTTDWHPSACRACLSVALRKPVLLLEAWWCGIQWSVPQ